jgi:elongation factor G
VENIEDDRDARAIKGIIPLAETFGYATNLRSISQGRASFTLQPKNYAPVPENRSKMIIAKRYGLPV